MVDQKVAFIVCVNDELEFSECVFYINRLEMPEGYEKDIISVREADSMASGYNAAMKSSDAKYKVYLHQDTFLWDTSFVSNMIKAFEAHPEVGIMGVVGVNAPITKGNVISLYNTGKCFHNLVPSFRDYDSESGKAPLDETIQAYVNALDGLILMTQYDLRWREEIFDGWDFYDASQCMEFKNAGYQVAVPKQEYPWAFHDCNASKYRSYASYQEKYVREYFPKLVDDSGKGDTDAIITFEEKIGAAKSIFADYIVSSKHQELWKFFADPLHCGYVRLRDWELLARIDAREREAGLHPAMWDDKIKDPNELLEKLQILRLCLRRIIFRADNDGETQKILKGYTPIALEETMRLYGFNTDFIEG